ncbi:MAG: hypothetical protein IPH09_14425 [bacterium]|nr:hypothetical protein [bacterium]
MEMDSNEPWTACTDADDYTAQIKSLFPDPVPPAITRPLPTTEPPFSAFWGQSRIDRLLFGSDCYMVLNSLGMAMLKYRGWGQTNRGSRLPNGVLYDKRFQADHDWSKGHRPAGFHPERVVFGLPHNYGSHANNRVNAEKHERRASPILFHVHPVGDRYAGVSIYLPSQFLPIDEKINAGGVSIPARIDWSIITDFLDGKVGNPPPPNAAARFPVPDKEAVLP